MSKNDEVKITPLGEDNYITWKWQMTMMMKSKGLFECLEADTKDDENSRRATVLIASALSQQNMQRVINCSTAKEIWTTLEASFENKSSTERTMLMEQFMSYKINSISDISKSIGDIQAKAARLKSLGATIDDETIISVILKALPDNLKTWKSTWRMVNAESPKLNTLITGVMAEVCDMKSPENVALVAQHSSRGFNRNNLRNNWKTYDNFKRNGPNKNITCNYCNKIGHLAKDCWKRQNNERTTDTGVAMMAIIDEATIETTFWMADSGCNIHMTPKLDWFANYEPLDQVKHITLGDNSRIPAKGIGTILTTFGILMNVHYVPELANNLFSISAATNNNVEARYNKERIVLTKGKVTILEGKRSNGVYMLEIMIKKQSNIACAASSLEIWHEKLCHISPDTIQRMIKENSVNDLDLIDKSKKLEQCQDCILGKGTHASHPMRRREKSEIAGASLHFDTVGPFKESSLNLAKYILLCRDEASGYRFARPIQTKGQIADEVKKIISKSELETKSKVLAITTDNGSEFVNSNLESFLNERGIVHTKSVPYTPQQNGYIERDVRTVIETARTLLNKSQLPKKLWAEAVNTSVYVLNRTLSSRHTSKTAYELWFKSKPSLKNLHIFGQEAIVLYHDAGRSKWDEKGVRQIFVGYTDKMNTFRFYDYETDAVYSSCDVTFIDSRNVHTEESNEEVAVITGQQEELNEQEEQDPEVTDSSLEMSWYDDEKLKNELDSTAKLLEEIDTFTGTPKMDAQQRLLIPTTSSQSEVVKYSRKDQIKDASEKLKPSDIHPGHIIPTKLRSDDKTTEYHAKLATVDADHDPISYNDAMSRNDRDKWVVAMKEEINSLMKNDVWQLVDRPHDNVVTNKWVYKIKRNPEGKIERYKARLVARGFSQVYGIDYLETYAPVAGMTSIRMLFAYAALEQLEIKQFDIKTAFLYGDLDETVFMEQPEGFCKDPNKVCLLKRSLYGLKQAPRQWNIKFSNFLNEMNLKPSENDECIFYRREPMVIIAIYVDDGIILARRKIDIDLILEQLSKRFEVHFVNLSTFLGFQVNRTAGGEISLNQSSYINTIIRRFNMENSKPVDSPISPTPNLNYDDKPLDAGIPYREAIGSLMYAAVTTRVDIAYAVGRASRHVEKPTIGNWMEVKRIFRYLRGKETFALNYQRLGNKDLLVYCDSDFAGDIDTSRSTTGSVFMLANGPIQWKSQRQSLVTLSSTEAEFVSICSTVKETINIRKLAIELGILNQKPITIFCDNQSAIRIASNEKSIHRTRHMSVQVKYPQEQIEAKNIEIEHIDSRGQLADMLTKPTTIQKFVANNRKLMATICMIMFTLLLSIQGNMCYLFERVSPIVWIPTDHFVETGTNTLTLELTYGNPCDTVPTHKLHKYASQTLQEEDYQIYRQVQKDCQVMFELQWVSRITEMTQINLSSEQVNDHQLIRKKRNPFLLLIAGIVIIVQVVTNLISMAVDWINPNSDSNQIKEIRSQTTIDRARLDDLENRFNMSERIQQQMMNSMDTLSQKVYENSNKIQHLTDVMPRIVWVGAYLQNLIQEAGARLEFILHDLEKKQAATKQMAALWNITELKQIEPEDTIVEAITRKSNMTISMRLAIRVKSENTRVYRIFAFDHWTNLTGLSYQVKYAGPRFLIYNSTSKCMRGIEDPTDRGVQDECKAPNWVDPKLRHWVKIRGSEDDKEKRPVVKRLLLSNYIYCIGHNITIDDVERQCPTEPFKLPISIKFTTYGHSHDAATQKISGKGPQWKMVDTTLPSLLLPETTSKDLHLLKSLDELKSSQNILQLKHLDSVIIQKYGYSWWLILIITTVPIVMIMVYGISISVNYLRRLSEGYEATTTNSANKRMNPQSSCEEGQPAIMEDIRTSEL